MISIYPMSQTMWSR